MTVWSAEKLTNDAKRHILRLPRARSTPSSRHWMLQRDAGVAAAASSLSNSTPKGRTSRPSLLPQPVQLETRQQFFRPRAENPGPPHAKLESMQTQSSEPQQLRVSQPEIETNRDVGNLSFTSMPSRIEKVFIGNDMSEPIPTRCGSSAQRLVDSPQGYGFSASAPVAGIKKVYREVSSGPKQLTRQLSVPSEEAMRQLGELDKVLLDIEQRVGQLSRLAAEQAQLTPDSAARLKTRLAQLEADAHKLETNGVDGIYTSALKSGQAFAKECKKAQLRRLEKLFSVIEGVFRSLNAASLSSM